MDIPRLPIDRDMYRYIPPCLDTDVPAVAGSESLCILAQGMRRSHVLHPCPRDAFRSGQDWQSGSVGEDQTQAPSTSGLVWSGAQGDAWAPHPIPNCKKTELRLGYRLPIDRDTYGRQVDIRSLRQTSWHTIRSLFVSCAHWSGPRKFRGVCDMFGLTGTTFWKLPVPRKPVPNVSGLTLENSPAGGAAWSYECFYSQHLAFTFQ